MSQASGSTSFALSSNRTFASGPCRLLGVSLNVWSQSREDEIGDRVYPGQTGYLIAQTRISLRDVSASGAELFSFHIPVGKNNWSCGQTPYTFMFGDGYILFGDGIHVPALTGNSFGLPLPAKSFLTVYYEGA
jgi:hypothetical protein